MIRGYCMPSQQHAFQTAGLLLLLVCTVPPPRRANGIVARWVTASQPAIGRSPLPLFPSRVLRHLPHSCPHRSSQSSTQGAVVGEWVGRSVERAGWASRPERTERPEGAQAAWRKLVVCGGSAWRAGSVRDRENEEGGSSSRVHARCGYRGGRVWASFTRAVAATAAAAAEAKAMA
ncbi:hypothetical protein GGR56DRAFT_639977 [Xylariaceae sp. FL0804]|nr:hypothetical protein GGR56DRAFT_639977 [Xylariaceae sp. FL0804]